MGLWEKRKSEKDREAEFDRLYKENEKRIFAIAWRLTGDVDAAEDIRQKTFLTLHTKLKKVLKHPKPDGWLVKTAFHYIKHYKRERAYRLMHETSLELAERMAAPQPVNEVEEFLDDLPDWVGETDKKMLLGYYCYGYTLREISGMIGLTYGSTRIHMSRLIQKLRERGFGQSE